MERSVAKVVAQQIGRPRMRRASRVAKPLLLLGADSSRRVNDSYRIVRQLGAGGFGSVYLAESRVTNETVAIKHITKLGSQQDMKFLHSELESLLRLDHPNIAKFHRFFEDEQAVYVVTEFCSDGDFCELLGRGPRDAEVRQLFRDIVIAVAYCHAHGVVHRDIKFENCLIQSLPQQRRVGKVIDFGLSAIRREGDTEHWLNDTLGSRYFVAPEVLDTSISYGEKVDCWALGVMLYVLLTDEHPFAEQVSKLSDSQLLQMIASRALRTQPLEDAGVDEDARDFILSLLRRDPQERLDSQSALFHAWLDVKKQPFPLADGGARSSRPSAPDPNRSRLYSAPPVKLEEQLIARIRTFGSFTRFERAVLTLVAHYAEEREVSDVQAAFFQLDTSRSGTLTRPELRQGLEMCGHGMSDEEFEELFRSLDGDGTGEVAYTEWLAATMESHVLASKSAIEQLYNLFAEEGVVRCQRLRSVFGRDRSFAGILGESEGKEDATLNEQQFKALMWDIAASMEKGGTPRSEASPSSAR